MKRLSILAVGAFIALVTTCGAGNAADLTFTLVNKTKSTLERFYTSPVGTKDWEEDVFGKDVLEPGESIKITISDGRSRCKYDMRFEFTQDSDLEDMEDTQDLCEMSTYTITE